MRSGRKQRMISSRPKSVTRESIEPGSDAFSASSEVYLEGGRGGATRSGVEGLPFLPVFGKLIERIAQKTVVRHANKFAHLIPASVVQPGGKGIRELIVSIDGQRVRTDEELILVVVQSTVGLENLRADVKGEEKLVTFEEALARQGNGEGGRFVATRTRHPYLYTA